MLVAVFMRARVSEAGGVSGSFVEPSQSRDTRARSNVGTEIGSPGGERRARSCLHAVEWGGKQTGKQAESVHRDVKYVLPAEVGHAY